MPVVIIFGVVSVGLIVLAAVIARPAFAARRGAVRVIGECVRHGDYISHGQTMYYPIFRVVLPDGRTVEHETRTGLAKNWKSPKVGAKRSLLYRAGVENELEMTGLIPFLPSIILLVVGIGFLLTTLGTAAAVDRVKSDVEHDLAAPRPTSHHHHSKTVMHSTDAQ